jgi:DNA polymerase sigma
MTKVVMSRAQGDEISELIEAYYIEKHLSEEECEKRMGTILQLQPIIDRVFPNRNAQLKFFGSSTNGFGVKGSDMDMVLMIDQLEDEEPADLVEALEEALEEEGYEEILGLPKARVPVVKFKDKMSGLGCDVCFNNALALRNSGLLATYSSLDPRLKKLAFAVKRWANCRRINTTFEGTLSSYAYVLMTIHFLQSRRTPVLPVLQQITRDSMNSRVHPEVIVSGFDTYYYEDVSDPRLVGFGRDNHESIGKLLFEFFMFYGFYFNFKDKVISPRIGGILTKEEKEWTKPVDKAKKSNYWFCVEDPFELSHNLGRTVDKGSMFNLRYEFRRGAHILANSFKWEEATNNKPRGNVLEMLLCPFDKTERQLKI